MATAEKKEDESIRTEIEQLVGSVSERHDRLKEQLKS